MLYANEQTSHKSFCERVIERMKSLEFTLTQISLKSGIPETKLKNTLYKNIDLPREFLIKLAQALETSVEYLATGSPAASDVSASTLSLSIQTPERLARALDIVPRATSNVSPEPPFQSIPLPKRILERYNVAAENVRAVSINTQALAPTLTQNDVALVDISSTDLTEGVYILAIRNSVIIRNVSPISKGFALSCTNAHIFGTTINTVPETGDLADPDVKVIGKIFCKMGMTDL